jgi:hypothetical protein
MSDRPQGSVRTGARGKGTGAPPAGAEAAPAKGEAGAETPLSATQSIPTGQNPVARPASAAAPASAPVMPPATGERPAGAAAGTGADTGTAAPTGTAAGGVASAKAAVKAAVRSAADKGKGSTAAGRKPVAKGGRGPRRARLQLRHIDTWSAFKISFVLSVALFFIWMVAVGVLYGVLGGLGVFVTLNELFGQLSSSAGGDVITPGVVFGAAAVIGAVNIILLTALGTVSTFIYNLCSDLVGGLEVTLSERD